MKIRELAVAFCLALPLGLFAAEIDFSRMLKFGMRGEDVRMLQVLLNSDADTRVAEEGHGSKGKETGYFGLATKRALIKFQEKYRAEILTPVGLVSGNGVFGTKTRAKARALKGATSENDPVITVASSTKATTPVIEKGEVVVMFPSQYSGKPGTMITLSGAGFTATDNTIYFGSVHAIEHASSQGGQMITFAIPVMPKGLYNIYVKNARGESDHEAFFVVTDGVTPGPKIESVTYTANKDIVIHGSGFTTGGNMVRAGTGVYEGVSSLGGKTITVHFATTFGSVDNLPAATIFTSAPKEVKRISLPVDVIVVNDNGVSNNKSFTLEL